MILRNIFLLTKHYILFIILLFVLSSCGLQTSPYLEAPDVVTIFTSGIPSTAEINNRTDYDPEIFRGYEIYYKYYDFITENSDIAEDNKNIFDKSEPGPEDVTAAGYKRVNTVLDVNDQTNYPMIPVDYSDRDSSFTLYVNFLNVASNTPPTVSYLSYPVLTLRRLVYEDVSGNNEYKTFIPDDHDAGDTDRPDSDKNTLSLYIFAYGKSDNVYNIYSKPVWLGKINYDN